MRDRVKVEFHDLGEHEIKNIPRPLRVWEWRCPTAIPRRLQNVTLPAMDRPSVVIMAFRNLTGDPDLEYFTDGLRMDIQNALVKVSGLFLIASGSAYAFRERRRRTLPARSAQRMRWRAASGRLERKCG
ncbi:hypothetical protein ACF1BQ_035360 [Bradyrhizobium sp. RDT10]